MLVRMTQLEGNRMAAVVQVLLIACQVGPNPYLVEWQRNHNVIIWKSGYQVILLYPIRKMQFKMPPKLLPHLPSYVIFFNES